MWGSDDFVNLGLFPGEIEIAKLLPKKGGDLLLFGIGGGREALVLGKKGFKITGVDFVKGLVERSIEHGKRAGIEIKGVVNDIEKVEFDPGSFDVIWYSCSIYSSIPGRRNRIKSLKKAGEMLKDNGNIACFFYWNPKVKPGRLRWRIGKIISIVTFGNRSVEKGDLFKDSLEFLHAFSDVDDVDSEFKEAGFKVVKFFFPENSHNACALLRKEKNEK